ncbi:ATP-binding protein [Methanospirillum lacunae]|uniref:Cobalamin biosynthesis protein n=1 Tax=Methanospirillum lacunae TaxID=668570 RepID=A0A2V2MZC9_9EURY|nr:AAA family ATPase [Methanospirillum lacunae]PWR71670.1 cobalamin biosynthesis protein [Methanospirillum lacunae]
MKIIVTMGRGGTGKTSFVSLMADYFIRKGDTPLLLVDLDPDQNLGEMIGVDLEAEGRKTVAELLEDTFIGKGGTTIGVAPSERIEHRIWRDGLYEGKNFDFLALGTKWVEGCYCMPDAALRDALSRLTKQYKYVLIDAPGGLEHLNRRVTADVDEIFDVIGPSSKSFSHLIRAKRVAEESGIHWKNFSSIGGFLFPQELGSRAKEISEIRYLGKIEYDEVVANRVIEGLPLIGLPLDIPGPLSVKKILENAGY